MSGRLVSVFILLSAVLAGGVLYYLQVYGFYQEVAETEDADVRLVSLATNAPEPIEYRAFKAVDADSSPIRYRACFETEQTVDNLIMEFADAGDVTPRNAPRWFDCFDAAAIAAELRAGTARAFLGQKNVRFGVDRIVAITADGRGYVWHELNDCGAKAYDGTVVGEECPPPPKRNGDG